MARILSYPNMNVQFQYLSQKITAPPVVGHGIIKLLKPLHLIRIGVRASSNESGREVYSSPKKHYEPYPGSSSGPLIYPAEKYIKEHLEKPVPQDSEKAAQLARELREDIDQGIPEDVRHVLLKKLEPSHISTMWEIAGHNGTDSAAVAAMLLHRESEPEKWKGKIHREKIHRGIGAFLSALIDYFTQIDDFTMIFFRGEDSYLYGHLYYPGSIMKKHSVYFIVRDANGNLLGEEPCGLTLDTEKMEQQLRKPAKHPEKFMDRRIYIRCAAPNVLVGRVLRHDGEHLGHIVLIKDGRAPK